MNFPIPVQLPPCGQFFDEQRCTVPVAAGLPVVVRILLKG